MRIYMTEQRKLILSLLKSKPDSFFTIEEIEHTLKESDSNECSQSTIYRVINRLVSEGAIKRFAKEGSRKFVYQFIPDKACEQHLHLKCTDCGKLIHVDDSTTSILLEEILKKNNFNISESKTMMFGTCSNCK